MLIQELLLIEKVMPLSLDMALDDAFVELQKRMGAAKSALSLAHKLKNPADKKKHFASVLSNMNTIRAQLNHAIKQIEQFNRAESDHNVGE